MASKLLPASGHERSIIYGIEQHRIVIVVGETGSGKSTTIPTMLYKAGTYNEPAPNTTQTKRMICITQPRRVAAIQLAQRVADNLRCNLGTTVGYAVRFDDVSSEETMIKFMTEGLLIRELMFDPLLTKYSVIMVDEVHERNLNTDLLLGLLKCLMAKRDDLNLIICSATMNIDEVQQFFTYTDKSVISYDEKVPKPTVIVIEGQTYPVTVHYKEEPVANYLDSSVDTVMNIHESNRLASGKILVFLTGQDEVEYVCQKLKVYVQTCQSRLDLKKLYILPLHASLKPEEVSRVFEDFGRNTRVCIVSTNVAETSLTIDDAAFVVDCGFVKLRFYDHTTGMDSLLRVPISKSSARQRAGRAGRTRAGVVYRLYPESEFELMADNTIPELQRSSLAETVLLLKSLGVGDVQHFPLISSMPRGHITVALELLYALNAIDDSGELTSRGEAMAQMNIEPKLSAILVSPGTSLCTQEVCRIVAMLQVKEIYAKPGRLANKSLWTNKSLVEICASEGDLPSYLNILNGFFSSNKCPKWAEKRNLSYQALANALEISNRLEVALSRMGKNLGSGKVRVETIQRSIVEGLFSNAAYLHPSGDYRTVRGDKIVHIHPNSVFSEAVERPKYVMFAELLCTTKSYMRHIMAIEQSWLLEAAPHYYTFGTGLGPSKAAHRDLCPRPAD